MTPDFRRVLIGGLAVAALIAIVGMISLVEQFALFRYDGETWQLSAHGWSIYYQGWVFWLPAVALSMAVCLVLASWAYRQAEDIDHQWALSSLKRDCQNQIRHYEQQAQDASQRAEVAEQNAKAHYETALATAQERERQAEAALDQAQELQIQAQQTWCDAQKQIDQARQQVRRASKKKDNAMAAAERIKRKMAKINNQT